MDPRGFHTITLGCKLNQFDTAAIEALLTHRGYRRVERAGQAAVVVINTCTVTGRADADARKRIRKVHRENPDCRLLVTGCYAELEPEVLRSIDGVDCVFGNREKAGLAGILDELGLAADERDAESAALRSGGGLAPRPGDRGCDAGLALPPALRFGDRSRAFLKIQEGCRLACSYCVIPRVRGASRSVEPDEVESAAMCLFRSGYRELVLTGINTGDYGRDLEPRRNLSELLLRLLAICGPNRVRLNSLEPLTVDDRLIRLMSREPRLAPHLQIPLQSGSDEILGRMRRNYRTSAYLKLLRRLRDAVPQIGLGADVIVGFPGEDHRQFRETYEFIESSPLNYLHVFSWSARPGTPASDLDGRVPESEIRERSATLRGLAADLSLRFRQRFEGRILDAVVLGPRPSDGAIRALTGNFIEVLLPRDAALRGEVLQVQLLTAGRNETTAERKGVPEWAVGRLTGQAVGPPSGMACDPVPMGTGSTPTI